jgi:hypothetical protein
MTRYCTARAAPLVFAIVVGLGCAALEPWNQYGPGDRACWDKTTTEAACASCCEQHHSVQSKNFYNAQYYACICTQQECQAKCAKTDCSDTDAGSPQPGDPCYVCESAAAEDDGGCAPAVVCQSDTDCLGLGNCYNNCP